MKEGPQEAQGPNRRKEVHLGRSIKIRSTKKEEIVLFCDTGGDVGASVNGKSTITALST